MSIELARPREQTIHELGAWGYLDSNNVANLLLGKSSDDHLRGAIIEFKTRWGDKYGLSCDDELDEEITGVGDE